jgi:formate dehydrogenase subunit delta
MENQDMIRMANQIAGFFKGYGKDEAKVEISNHINSFWDPRMRRHLFAFLDSGGKGLDPLVVEASSAIRRPASPANQAGN